MLFEDKWRPIAQSVKKFCFKLNRNEHEDLYIKTYIKAFTYYDQYKHNKSFQAWVFQIAKNLHFDMYRSQNRRAPTTSLDVIPDHTLPTTVDDLTQIEYEDFLRTLEDKLRKLPLKYQELYLPLFHHIIHGLEAKEIAEEIEVAERTVKSRLHRLRKIIAHILAEDPMFKDYSSMFASFLI